MLLYDTGKFSNFLDDHKELNLHRIDCQLILQTHQLVETFKVKESFKLEENNNFAISIILLLIKFDIILRVRVISIFNGK